MLNTTIQPIEIKSIYNNMTQRVQDIEEQQICI